MADKFVTKLEIKELTQAGTFSGMASVYGIIDSDNDIIQAGAFSESIARRKVKMLWQHDRDEPIGIFTKIEERGNILYVEGELAMGVEQADAAYILLKQGAVDGLSVGFVTKEYDYDVDSNVRTITKAELYEVSIVTFPANEAAKITNVKSFQELLPKDVERALRKEFNLSQSEAKAFMAKGYSAVKQCDVAENTEDESQRDVDSLGNELKKMVAEVQLKNLAEYILKTINK